MKRLTRETHSLDLRSILESGLFHCTTIKSFKAVRRDGAIKPNLDDRPPQHGVTRVSRCFKLGAISLFETGPGAKRNWLQQWLTAHKPITIAIKVDPDRMERDKLLSCTQARELTSGVMLPGEVCYRGEIPLECVSGFLLVWAEDRTIYTWVPGNTLTDQQISTFRKHARSMPQNPKIQIPKIVSGAQTGADRAALDWAIKNNVPHGGWCPKGRRSEDGIVPECYNVKELTRTSYLYRTERNVIDSDGTVILSIKSSLSGGSKRTAEFARRHGKPLLHIHPGTEDPGSALRAFVSENRIEVLNVAGPRASTEPTIGESVMRVLDEAFSVTTQHELAAGTTLREVRDGVIPHSS